METRILHTTIRSNTSAELDPWYLIEYKPDPAIPETATRTVSVTDTKMPYHEMLNITSDNANNTRATINDILTIHWRQMRHLQEQTSLL